MARRTATFAILMAIFEKLSKTSKTSLMAHGRTHESVFGDRVLPGEAAVFGETPKSWQRDGAQVQPTRKEGPCPKRTRPTQWPSTRR